MDNNDNDRLKGSLGKFTKRVDVSMKWPISRKSQYTKSIYIHEGCRARKSRNVATSDVVANSEHVRNHPHIVIKIQYVLLTILDLVIGL